MRRKAILLGLIWIGFMAGGAVASDSSFIAKERAQKGSLILPLPPTLPAIPGIDQQGWRPKSLNKTIPFVAPPSDEITLKQGIYNWLCVQQSPLTGLVPSFEGSSDLLLKDQAATYDQALAGMAFLILGDTERCRRILEFYAPKFKGTGFYNFYSAKNGRVGIEWRRHLGPNMWIALLAFQYSCKTGDKSFIPMAEGLCDWVLSLPCYNGGPAMSDLVEPEIPWHEIVSTENVIDAVAVFEIAVQLTEEVRKKEWYSKKLAEMKAFLKNTAVQPQGLIARGFRPFIDGLDETPALDTITWLMAAALPENMLKEYGVSSPTLFYQIEKVFGVEGQGYDFTSQEEAKAAGRERIITLEWSGEVALCYWLESQHNEEAKQKLNEVLSAMDQFQQQSKDQICYPYASQADVLTFSDGWRTPQKRPNGSLAGSVAGTCWRLFADFWNPLRLDQPLSVAQANIKTKPYVAAKEEEKRQAALEPSAYTSEGLTTAAWLNLRMGKNEKAREYATECIGRYSDLAREQQKKKKEKEGGLIKCRILNEEVKSRIFSYAALNDVAACWFILSKVDASQRGTASQKIHTYYSLAQVWDPSGWFWTVAEAIPKSS